MSSPDTAVEQQATPSAPGPSIPNSSIASITTEDLMRFVDGELDAEMEAVVLNQLENDEHSRAIVMTLLEIGNRVREHADMRAAAAGADGIASLVMARIGQDSLPNTSSTGMSGKVVPLGTVAAKPTGVAPIAVGGLVFAAAAAFLLWQFGGDYSQPVTAGKATLSAANGTAVASIPSAFTAPGYQEQEPVVTVDAVDFGARTGSIFYVPGNFGPTPVVWLADDPTVGSP